MSRINTEPTPSNTERKNPFDYDGKDQYNDWIEDYLELRLSEAQRQINRSVKEHEKTLVYGANGFGKSYDAAGLSLAFLFSNPLASVLATSGTYGKLKRTYCKPVEQLHREAWGLPGEYKQAPPRIDIEERPDVFLQATSPADAGELEGVHNRYVLGVVEEADKDAVDENVLDSMESLLTDHRDRLLVIANPPKDEANIVATLMEDPTWNVLQFSSFDSHNVQVEIGEAEGPFIPDLVTLDRIKQDWVAWNGREWPGVEAARASDDTDDLDERWYRRRMGVMPPTSAMVHRPFEVSDVQEAFAREPMQVTSMPQGLALDVARGGGDFNALAGRFGDEIRVLSYWSNPNWSHNENNQHVRDTISSRWTQPFAVDAIGEGSGLADMIDTWYPDRVRFNSGSIAAESQTYKNCWAEGMAALGDFMDAGGTFAGQQADRLREEMMVAARVCEFETRYIKQRDTEVYEVTPKDEVKEALGRSPDLLDAAMMSAWMASEETGKSRSIPSTW